jgi:phytoene dehydrogenase-like protein
MLIVGGGLAGLSAGCHARANGFDVTIVEHNLALGGVCTAWHRGPYLIDGRIHWLTGGPFLQLYEELGILPAVTLHALDAFATYRHARDGWHATLRRDLRRTEEELRALAPEDAKRRIDAWPIFQPIVLASFGVAQPLADQPSTLLLDGIEPLTLGGRTNEHVYLRIYNDDPTFAPYGHAVIQAMLSTDYDWWATRGALYQREKDLAAERVLTCLDGYLPGVKAQARLVDLATPLTFWRNPRAWRGAFEGWIPGRTPSNTRHARPCLPPTGGDE